MMKKIFLLLVLIASSTFGAINEYKTDIYFGNGILTTDKEAEDAALNILFPSVQTLYGTEMGKGSMLEFCINQDGQPAKMKSPKQAQSEAKKTVKNFMSPGRCSPGSSDRLRPRKGDDNLFFHLPIRFRTWWFLG